MTWILVSNWLLTTSGEKRQLEVDSDVIMVMRTSLSMKEFASALGMKESDVFVKKMFAIVDKDNDNRISFQEFLDMIVLFSKGRTDDKLQVSTCFSLDNCFALLDNILNTL